MTALPTKFRVGRRDPVTHRLQFAFHLERTDAGGLRLTGIASRPNTAERSMLFSHFGMSAVGLDGGQVEDRLVTRLTTEPPGTPMHFVRQIHLLPDPFSVMSRDYEKWLR